MKISETKKQLTNGEMDTMLISLEPLMERKGLVGYAVARNYRALRSACQEYLEFKRNLIRKYGKPVESDGEPTGEVFIPAGTAEIDSAITELAEFAPLEHEVTICLIPIEDVIDELTAKELITLEWMFEEDKHE